MTRYDKAENPENYITFSPGKTAQVVREINFSSEKVYETREEVPLCGIEDDVDIRTTYLVTQGDHTKPTSSFRIKDVSSRATFLQLRNLVGKRVKFTKKVDKPMGTTGYRNYEGTLLNYNSDSIAIFVDSLGDGSSEGTVMYFPWNSNWETFTVNSEDNPEFLNQFLVRFDASNVSTQYYENAKQEESFSGLPISRVSSTPTSKLEIQPRIVSAIPGTLNPPNIPNVTIMSFTNKDTLQTTLESQEQNSEEERGRQQMKKPIKKKSKFMIKERKEAKGEEQSKSGPQYTLHYQTNRLRATTSYLFVISQDNKTMGIDLNVVIENSGKIEYNDAHVALVVEVPKPMNRLGFGTDMYQQQELSPSDGGNSGDTYGLVSETNFSSPMAKMTARSSRPKSGSYSEEARELDISLGDVDSQQPVARNRLTLGRKVTIADETTSSLSFLNLRGIPIEIRYIFNADVSNEGQFDTELRWKKGKENLPSGKVTVIQTQGKGEQDLSLGRFTLTPVPSSKLQVKNLLDKALGISAKWTNSGSTKVPNTTDTLYNYFLSVTNQHDFEKTVFIRKQFAGSTWEIEQGPLFDREEAFEGEESTNFRSIGVCKLVIPPNDKIEQQISVRVSS